MSLPEPTVDVMGEPAPTDVELLARMAEGDEAALHELYDRHAAWLVLRLRRRAPDEDVVAEVVHDTFLAAWRGAASYRGDGDVGAWLWGIAIRRLISRLRRRPAPVPMASQVLSALAPAEHSAEDELLVAMGHGGLGDAMRSLSPDLRRALTATVVDGLTSREAARLLGIPVGTVKSRVRLAKQQLRRHLQQIVNAEEW